ncbi:protein FAM131C [Tupaia chinensis]|uniref:protein FAM131C n=1 Tax=Tupaia chinensis TaxID=246437 RepID=UPI0003C92396|nr:protein FAM131C [Tupaia chinensis]
MATSRSRRIESLRAPAGWGFCNPGVGLSAEFRPLGQQVQQQSQPPSPNKAMGALETRPPPPSGCRPSSQGALSTRACPVTCLLRPVAGQRASSDQGIGWVFSLLSATPGHLCFVTFKEQDGGDGPRTGRSPWLAVDHEDRWKSRGLERGNTWPKVIQPWGELGPHSHLFYQRQGQPQMAQEQVPPPLLRTPRPYPSFCNSSSFLTEVEELLWAGGKQGDEPGGEMGVLHPVGDLFTSAHKDCPVPQGTDPLNPDLISGHPPTTAPESVTGKDKQMDFCWDPWQRCFQTTNGYLSDSRSCSSNYNVAALATSSLVGVVQSIKDHITKPTAMARGRVAHLIEWKGWSAQRSGWELSPAEDERYHCLPEELREARFAAGVAEQFAITEATLSAWSSLDDEELHPESSHQDLVQLQDLESICLQDSLLSGPSQDDSLLAFSPGLTPDDGWPSPEEPPITAAGSESPGLGQQLRRRLPGGPEPEGGARLLRSLPSVDSGSLSEEDEVFYN